eukprot:3136020-Pleurochrysis_carterae.AAC.1
MSDTCNAARATKRRLVAVVEAAARAQVADEAWERLDAVEQSAAVRVYTGDCAQHLRNMVLSCMSAADAAYLKSDLEDTLADFFAFECMTTEMSAIIRAVYKELHHKGDYAMGKGRREFIPCLINAHGKDVYIPLKRADGGREVLDFDGALPICTNRRIFLSFLKTLIFELGHSNILEDFLWTVLRSEEII